MKGFRLRAAALALELALLLAGGRQALALEDQKVVGVLVRFDVASDGKAAEAVLKDLRKEKEIKLFITNELVIDKLRNGKMAVGAEVRAKYESRDGKNHCSYFRKVSGE